jgi:hypothetical protein
MVTINLVQNNSSVMTIKNNLSSCKKSILFLIGFLSILNGFVANAQAGYPVPQRTDKMLFYLQRSHNKNTIVYDLNTLPNGSLDKDDPVKMHWIRFEEGGRKADLSFIQRKAFGVKCKATDNAKTSFVLKFNNFNKRDMLLAKTAAGYKALIKIANETAELESVFIKAENNALGMPLSFKYIELSGISIKTKKKISERINL